MVHRAAVVPFLLLALATSGCSREAKGQTVAVVNGEEITAGELNAELARANLPSGADKQTARATLLQQIIGRRLLAQKATEAGIDKSPQYLAERRAGEEQLLIRLAAQRQANLVKLPDQATIDRYIAANPSMFAQRANLTLDQMEFAAPSDRAALDQMKDDHSMAQLAATLTSLNVPVVRRRAVVDSATIPPQVMKQISTLPVTEPFIIPIGGGRMVANVVVGREPVASEVPQNRRIAAELIRNQQINQAIDAQLDQLRKAAKIEYQPGYAPKQPAAAGAGTGAPKV